MTKSLFYLCIPMLLLSKEICLDIDKNISTNTMQSTVPEFIVVQDTDLKNDLKMKRSFAKDFLKTINEKEKEKLTYATIETLYKYQKDKIFEKEKATNITDDIAYSYYIVNKEKFFIPEQINLRIFIFKNKKDADNFDKNSTNVEVKDFHNLPADGILPEISLAILNLNPNEISETFLYNKHYSRVSYTNKSKSSYAPFENVKETIKNELLKKKQNEILQKIYAGDQWSK